MNGNERNKIIRLAEVFKILGNPVRLCLFMKIIEHERINVTGLTDCMGVSQSSISQHLAKLRDLKLVKTEKVEQMVFYSCNDEYLKKLIELVKGWNLV